MIVAITDIQRRARAHFNAGGKRDDHGFNWHADALVHWLAERERLAAAGKVSHASHAAPAGRARVELAQGAV